MFGIVKTRHAHSDRVERWLGKAQAEHYSGMLRDWYGPPIAIAGVPGVSVARGGDFVGTMREGRFASLLDLTERMNRIQRRAFRRLALKGASQLHAGFSSLSDLIAEATVNGKGQDIWFSKAPTTATTAGNAVSGWNVGAWPAAGGVGGASGTGRVCTDALAGAMKFTNAAVGDTLHVVSASISATAVSGMMLADRLWDMTYNHATATSTAIDAANRPTRYQAADTAPGNFISGEITTALSATAHNLTVTYVDDAGNTAEAAAAYAAPVSAVVNRSPTVAGQWFVSLNSGDQGARYLTNIAQSTITSVTGVTTWWIAHPLCFIPIPVANVPYPYSPINGDFNLPRVYDDACLFIYNPSVASAATITHTGHIKLASG